MSSHEQNVEGNTLIHKDKYREYFDGISRKRYLRAYYISR